MNGCDWRGRVHANGWFGQALAVGRAGAHKSVLLVGAPGYRDPTLVNITTVGRLYAYDTATAGSGKTPAALFSVTGEEPLAEFGAALATTIAVNSASAAVNSATLSPALS